MSAPNNMSTKEVHNILTIGTFDILHIGHVNFLNKCAALGRLYVGVNEDEYVRQHKGRDPVLPWDERAAVVGALRSVHAVRCYITPLSKPAVTTLRLLEIVSPTYLVVGADWAGRDYLDHLGITEDHLAARGCQLIYLPRSGTQSTSEILRRIRE